MKVFLVILVARQVLGDYIFVRTEKGFLKASAAEAYLETLKKDLIDSNNKPKVVKLTTPNGEADCITEVGIHEIEVE